MGEVTGRSLAFDIDIHQYRCMSKSELPAIGAATPGGAGPPRPRPPRGAGVAGEGGGGV
ncbi:hypothetical protein [Nocardia wallacei]|uniref:hypothetical protein n=1 Tax=Nocardia wallacei TaxID=480035 RepID=UPI0024543C70|nr:hypothetical protein [Nocardia wallacei]